MEIVTRAEAKERGLRHYFTGKPCKHGHVAVRCISNSDCMMCRPDAQRARTNKNIEKERERVRAWRIANPDRVRETIRAWRIANPDRVIEIRNRSRESNLRSYHKAKNSGKLKEHYDNNREKMIERSRKLYLEGPQNPKGEVNWLSKSKALLRTSRRILRTGHREQPSLRVKASTQEPTSPK